YTEDMCTKMLTAINLPVQRTRWPLSWSRIVRNCNMTTSVVYSSWCRYMVPALSPSYINVSPWYSPVVYKHTGVSPDSLAPLIVYWRLLACFDLGNHQPHKPHTHLNISHCRCHLTTLWTPLVWPVC
ncbi:hypothetical protein PV326_009944, partial [Microctonus aethiopoides]